ncbi:T9SS type A sorting domain-containing protein [candidate division KSB1 bacterium]|nr:T9SS type A sorting domain-containing protein [candidate division KSB1 bacterium]
MKKKICVRAKLSLGLCSFHLVIFIAVVALGQTDASSWRTLPNAPVAPDNGRFDDVFFINPETGWIANVAAGKIYKTTDGGESWIEQIEARNVFGYFVGFRCVGFASEQLGWAGNINLHNIPVARRSLFETRDGGRTWANISDRISGPDPAGICGLWVVNDRLVYGAGRWNGPPMFIKSTDAGMSWAALDLRPLATGLVDVFFFNADSGLIVGGKGVGSSLEEQNASQSVILFTADGGKTWKTVYEGTTKGKWCWKISFPTRTIGYVATQGPTGDGIILKTTDGGLTWQEKFVGVGLGFSGIGFATSQKGWVGALGAYETLDGGESWQEVANVGQRINRFRILSATLGYAAGETVYKFSSDQSTSVFDNKNAGPTAFALLQNHPNPFEASTTIAYHLKQSGFVELSVYNVRGRTVAILVREHQPAGKYGVAFDGSKLPNGIYFCKIQSGNVVEARKMILMR